MEGRRDRSWGSHIRADKERRRQVGDGKRCVCNSLDCREVVGVGRRRHCSGGAGTDDFITQFKAPERRGMWRRCGRSDDSRCVRRIHCRRVAEPPEAAVQAKDESQARRSCKLEQRLPPCRRQAAIYVGFHLCPSRGDAKNHESWCARNAWASLSLPHLRAVVRRGWTLAPCPSNARAVRVKYDAVFGRAAKAKKTRCQLRCECLQQWI